MQIQNFTVNDRESSPVAHTFEPRSAALFQAGWAESGATAEGEKTLTLNWRNGDVAKDIRRQVRLRFAMPLFATETVNGVERQVYQDLMFADAKFMFGNTTTRQQRSNFVGMFAGMLDPVNAAVIDETLTGLSSVW